MEEGRASRGGGVQSLAVWVGRAQLGPLGQAAGGLQLNATLMRVRLRRTARCGSSAAVRRWCCAVVC